MERRENLPVGAEVGMAHVCAFERAREFQSDTAEFVGSHDCAMVVSARCKSNASIACECCLFSVLLKLASLARQRGQYHLAVAGGFAPAIRSLAKTRSSRRDGCPSITHPLPRGGTDSLPLSSS